MIIVLEFLVVWYLIFVLIIGDVGCNKGIVWCCMFVFISVWEVLLCFRNGMEDVVIDIICFGLMFIVVILLVL